MTIANYERPRWPFYAGWVVLHGIAMVLAWYVAWTFISIVEAVVGGTIQVNGQSHITEDFLLVYALLPMIGLLTGALQSTLLRRYLGRIKWWIPATVLGWCLPFVLGLFFTPLLASGSSTPWIMFGMFLIGISIVLPQWWLLRQRVQHAFWWPLAYGFGWWIIGLLNQVTSEPFAVLLAIAVVPAIATGLTCWLLLDWYPQYQP